MKPSRPEYYVCESTPARSGCGRVHRGWPPKGKCIQCGQVGTLRSATVRRQEPSHASQ